MNALYKPQVKICGITNLKDAMLCLNAGVDAIGFIFAASRRRVTAAMASQIIAQMPPNGMRKAGVFMDADFDDIMQHVRAAGLDTIQLHGSEPATLIQKLQNEGLRVIKALFQKHAPYLKDIDRYAPNAFLLESDNRPETLAAVNGLISNTPVVLAGGLNAANLKSVIETVRPSAVDLNSGSEYTWGIKSAAKIYAVMQVINNIKYNQPVRRAF